MELKVSGSYQGFKLIQEELVKEINATGYIFEHEKTGAKLLYLKNDDDNKVFSIAFRTPPKDSTGVAHILEHSVLCGSRKFPTKEPFVELIKGSLNTFLNAFTFPDKTMYPVASKNNKDFANLMDVYLDAVFYPNIYKHPEIMMQEGWHYELENKEDDLKYKGVVYNEMKGAFSSPESILFRKISETLFPDTAYGVESGGDPDSIPKLTQEQFLDFHKKYYHPSNSYIFLCGDMDIQEKLKFINENYLKDFEKIQVDSAIGIQEPFNSPVEKYIRYPIAIDEKQEGKTYLSLNYAVGKAINPEICMAFDILEHMLLETPSAPLKKALVDANIGKDVFGSFDSGILQPIFSVVIKNTEDSEKEKFKKIVHDTLSELVEKGIDKRLIEASINIKEFQMREADFQGYPKGLIYSMKSLESWLYDQSPLMHLEYENTIRLIKKSLNSNYFENLIQKYILNNTHCSMLVLKPDKGFAEEKEQGLRKELSDYKASLSSSEISDIVNETKKLKERQITPDSKENLEKIPVLSILDIDKKAEELIMEEREELNKKVIFSNAFTNKIIYMNLYFDTTAVKQELVPYISLLSAVMGKISTVNYDYEELAKEINIYTGGIRYSSQVYGKKGSTDEYYPKFIVKSKVLNSNAKKLMEIVSEVVCNTIFDDKKRVKEIVQEAKSRLEMVMFDRGHMVVSSHVLSYFSEVNAYEDVTSGLSFYKFIEGLEKNFDEKADEILEKLKEVALSIFNEDKLLVSITSEGEDYSSFKENFNILTSRLGKEVKQGIPYKFQLSQKNEGLMTSGKVQYVAKAYNFSKLGYEYNGSLQVLKNITNYSYLWNQVRVQGGAYGCFSSFQRSGNMFFVSYRDPNLMETLKVYDQTSEFVKNLEIDEREITKSIIGTISDLDTPLTASMKGERAVENYIRQISFQDIQREREEILSTTLEKIRSFSDLIEATMKENYLCVLGNEKILQENKQVFNTLIQVFQ